MNLRENRALRICVRVRVRTWACVYTGAGGRRSHAALAFSRTAPSGAPSPLACSFTCPHPDISVPQSGLWQLAPLLLPAAPPLTGSEHVVPQEMLCCTAQILIRNKGFIFQLLPEDGRLLSALFGGIKARSPCSNLGQLRRDN